MTNQQGSRPPGASTPSATGPRAGTTTDGVALAAGDALRESAVSAAAAEETDEESSEEFSIDELRVIAGLVGVADRAQITPRLSLIREIRRRL